MGKSDIGKTYGIPEIAALLMVKPQSIRVRLMRNPSSLPPCIRLGRGAKVIWMEKDVKEWLEKKKG